jgi:hypothetical protein
MTLAVQPMSQGLDEPRSRQPTAGGITHSEVCPCLVQVVALSVCDCSKLLQDCCVWCLFSLNVVCVAAGNLVLAPNAHQVLGFGYL